MDVFDVLSNGTPEGHTPPAGQFLFCDNKLNKMPGDEVAEAPAAPAVNVVVPNLQPPPPLDVDSSTIVDGWKLWKQQWNNYLIVSGLGLKEKKYITALLLHCIGKEALRVYNAMTFITDGPRAEDKEDPDTIIKKFDEHFLGITKEFFERFKFNQRNQESNESIDQYLAALRNLEKTCGFCACMKEKLIMDRIILGIRDEETRKKLISQSKLDLEKTIDICRGMEAAARQMRVMNTPSASNEVHKVSAKSKKEKKYDKKDKSQSQEPHVKTKPKHKNKSGAVGKCKFCCQVHEFKRELCPAWGKSCNACKQMNHFSASNKCSKNRIHLVKDSETEYSSDCSSIASVTATANENVNSVNNESGPIFCEMLVDDSPIKFQIDCGATVNILPKKYVNGHRIRNESINLKMWNNDTTNALGKSKIKTVNPIDGKKYKVDYVVVEQDKLTPLLSRKAAEKMGLITVNYDKFEAPVSAVTSGNVWMHKYPKVFEDSEIGTLPGGEVHLTLEKDAQPVIKSPRSLPESMKTAVKKELDKLESTGVITKVDKPTDWVNQMAVAEKKNKNEIRICIDPRPLNLVLKREHYRLPVLDDVLPELSSSKVFSILDLKQGYLHCTLDEQSSYLTTMSTPFGRYRWLRMPFGLNVSSEIFQKRLIQALDGLQGVHCNADDVIIHGINDAEHDKNLKNLLIRAEQHGIRFNRSKCKFGLSELKFNGNIISSDGLKIDPDKIEAVLKMSKPENREAVERLRGTVNYLSRFIPKLTEVMYPISQLTHKNVEWNWGPAQDFAFSELKRLLTQAPVLAFFDNNKEVTIQCDSSMYGLGGTLLQNGKPIAYASRALHDAETRYAPIEREMLAIVWSLEKWHQFTYGRKVTVYTDHHPLESITRKDLNRAPRRLQGMLLRALAYDIDVKWLEGKKMFLSDTFSRAYLPKTENNPQAEFEVINAVKYLPMSEDKINQIKLETEMDEALQQLKFVIQNGWPDEKTSLPELAVPYFHFRDELAISDGLIFRGERLVIPHGLRNQVKNDLHVGHTGIESCLRRARETIYWPGMNAEIKSWIETCEACCEYEKSQPKEPLMSHEVPERPWQKVGVDIMTYKQKDYLITTDYRSNFWEIDYLPNTTSKTVIHKLKAHFARYGIPDSIVSDSGSVFLSDEFRHFRDKWGFEHYPSSAHHHQSNGKVESSVKTAKRMLRKCMKSGEDQYLGLLNIRNTPTQGVDSSPAQRLFGRRTKNYNTNHELTSTSEQSVELRH